MTVLAWCLLRRSGMFANDFKAMAVALAGLGLLMGGCAAETGEGSHALMGDAAVPTPTALRAPEGLERAAAPDWRLRASAGLVDGCSMEVCEAGEQCCALTGECVPVDCDDCCVTPERPDGVEPDPELDGPEGPDEPQ